MSELRSPINEPIDQRTYRPTDHQPTDQPTNWPTSQPNKLFSTPMSVFSMLALAGQTTGPNGLIFVEKSHSQRVTKIKKKNFQKLIFSTNIFLILRHHRALQIVKNILLVVYFSSFGRVEKCLDSWNKNDAFVNKK